MKIEHFKCEKCGCDKLIVTHQQESHLYIDPSKVYPEQLEMRCPNCGSTFIIRYNEPSSMRNYMIIDKDTGKRVIMIFTNVEGYEGHVVNTFLDDDMYVFFSRVGNDHKEYIMKDNNKLRSENAALKNEIEELKKKASVEEYMKLSDKCTCLINENANWTRMYNELSDRYKKLCEDKQNAIDITKADMQDKIDSLKVNLKYHVERENYFKEQYNKYKEMNERVCKDNERLKVELTADDSYRGKYENEVNINDKLNEQNTELKKKINDLESRLEWKELYEDALNENVDLKDKIKSLEASVKSWKDEADRAHSQIHWHCKNADTLEAEIEIVDQLNLDLKNKLSEKDKEIKSLNTRLDNLKRRYHEVDDEYTKVVKDMGADHDLLAVEYAEVCRQNKDLTHRCSELIDEIEKYKKQCSRLEHEKINAFTNLYDSQKVFNEEINKLRDENNKLKKDYRELSAEYVAYQTNMQDVTSYYKLWKDLADKYTELEDKYNKVYIQYEKYKKYCEDIVATKKEDLGLDGPLSEPSGTGCCLNEDE